jgi:hypothetical protein
MALLLQAQSCLAPACERPGRWYGDEVVRQDVSLLAKNLTVGTPTNEVFGVCQSRWPVKP